MRNLFSYQQPILIIRYCILYVGLNEWEADSETMEEWHPLLPVERKLILMCLILAAVLLVVLVWASNTYFRIGS